MGVIQSVFNEVPNAGLPGYRANGELTNDISRNLLDVSIGIGKAVYRAAADHQCTGTPAANKFLGFTMVERTMPVMTDRAADTFKTGDQVPIATRGSLWVVSAVAANQGDPVFVTPAGLITTVSAGNTAATGWEFDKTIAAAGNVVIVRR